MIGQTSQQGRTDPTRLPRAIWIRAGKIPFLYRGSPEEMVASMAKEIDDDCSVREALDLLVFALEESRGIDIRLPDTDDESIPSEVFCQLFIEALLRSGIARALSPA